MPLHDNIHSTVAVQVRTSDFYSNITASSITFNMIGNVTQYGFLISNQVHVINSS